MSYDMFRRVIDKFKAEGVRIRELEFGSWGEPLLNGELPRMIRYARDVWPPTFLGKKGAIGVSTNLNYMKDPEGLILSGINRIRISISGMTQEVYSKNHIGGNIETVMRNILKLVEVNKKYRPADLSIGIGWHDLKYNKHQYGDAKKFCEDNGLFFKPMQLYIPSVEDNIFFHREKEKMTKYYGQYIDVDNEVRHMKLGKDVEKCQFRRSVIMLNSDGTVNRCNCVYEPGGIIGNLFDLKIRSIPRIRSQICEICAKTPMSWR